MRADELIDKYTVNIEGEDNKAQTKRRKIIQQIKENEYHK